jgi:hypothetical protein
MLRIANSASTTHPVYSVTINLIILWRWVTATSGSGSCHIPIHTMKDSYGPFTRFARHDEKISPKMRDLSRHLVVALASQSFPIKPQGTNGHQCWPERGKV